MTCSEQQVRRDAYTQKHFSSYLSPAVEPSSNSVNPNNDRYDSYGNPLSNRSYPSISQNASSSSFSDPSYQNHQPSSSTHVHAYNSSRAVRGGASRVSQTPVARANNSSSSSNSVHRPDNGPTKVACPVCSSMTLESQLNAHLDECLTKMYLQT